MALLPFRLHADGGGIAVRDGIVFVLFMSGTHADVAERVGKLYDRWLAWVGPDTIQWVWAEGDAYKPATPRRRHRVRRLLTPAAAAQRPDERFSVKGGCAEGEPGAHLFEYWGSAPADPEAENPPPANTVEIWFPPELVESTGRATFVKKLLELAAEVPFDSGYASLAFNFEDWAMLPAAKHITGPAFRHPGMDVHCTWSTALEIRPNKVRGSYWLTLLGPSALAGVAPSADALRKALGPGITVHEIGRSVAIEAGDELRPGDLNRGDVLPLTRKVAEVLQPVLLLQDRGAFGFAGSDTVQRFMDWQERHLRAL
jgi:hypothetical protein